MGNIMAQNIFCVNETPVSVRVVLNNLIHTASCLFLLDFTLNVTQRIHKSKTDLQQHVFFFFLPSKPNAQRRAQEGLL